MPSTAWLYVSNLEALACAKHCMHAIQKHQAMHTMLMPTPAWFTEYSPTVAPGLTPRCSSPDPMCVRVSATCLQKYQGLSNTIDAATQQGTRSVDGSCQLLLAKLTCAYVSHVYGPGLPLLSTLRVPRYGICRKQTKISIDCRCVLPAGQPVSVLYDMLPLDAAVQCVQACHTTF